MRMRSFLFLLLLPSEGAAAAAAAGEPDQMESVLQAPM